MQFSLPAPICNPHPTPAVATQLGADQLPSDNLAITIPLPALPLNTNPALRIVKIANPDCISWGVLMTRKTTL
jgi:hypothetical protein